MKTGNNALTESIVHASSLTTVLFLSRSALRTGKDGKVKKLSARLSQETCLSSYRMKMLPGARRLSINYIFINQ